MRRVHRESLAADVPKARSLRDTLFICGAGLFIVTLAVVAVLGVLTNLLHRSVTAISTETDHVRAAQDVEVALLFHSNMSNRMAASDVQEFSVVRNAFEQHLRMRLRSAHDQASSTAEAELLDSIDEAIGDYFCTRNRMEREGRPFRETVVFVAASLDTAIERLERLVALNLDEVHFQAAHAAQWEQIGDAIAVVMCVVLLGGLLGAGRWIQVRVLRPFSAVHASISRYVGGEHGVRAACLGPAELRNIAQSFNRVADALAEQKGRQLASLASVAHDLKTPLTALKMGMSLLRVERTRSSQEMAEKTVALVGRQVDRLERMVGDFMDATRIERGELELRLERHDLRETIREVVELYRTTSPALTLALALPDEPLLANCDGTRVTQMLGNLVSNAIKFSPRGGTVMISARRTHDEIFIEVRDHGIGISPEEQAKIFEPFHRSEAARAFPGVGLGLSVAKRIASAHGGRIEVESVPGSGTTFRVAIPQARVTEPSPASEPTQPRSHAVLKPA